MAVMLPRAHGPSPRRLSGHPQQRRAAAACRRGAGRQRHKRGPRLTVAPRPRPFPGTRHRRAAHHKRRRGHFFPSVPFVPASPHATRHHVHKARRQGPRHLAWWQRKHSAAWWKHFWATHSQKAAHCPKPFVPFDIWVCTHPFRAQSGAAAGRAQRGRSAKPSAKAQRAARKPIKCAPRSRKRR